MPQIHASSVLLGFLSIRLVHLYAMASQGYERLSNFPEVGGDAPTLDDLETGGDESRFSRIPEDGEYGLNGGTRNRSDG